MPPVDPDGETPQSGAAADEQEAYQVLARKWRPSTFDELVGQRHVARALANAIAAGRLAHAYIFAGVRGTGKTTVARILAKCLNCERGPVSPPCNECAPCREIAEGRSIDVLEMDAASRTGVDNIRELQEVVSYAPARDRHRVFIIDEAHMLSKQAFNALLKTLEEPPPTVVFVLATTELHKILPTILSRCQVFEFLRVSAREVSDHLRRICETEGFSVSESVLGRIARAGEGSVRDSLSVLERVIAFCGETVSDEEALQVLGAVRIEELVDMTRALAGRDAPAMLAVLDRIVAEGHDLIHFWSELVSLLRDLLLMKTLKDPAELLSRPPEDCAALREASGGLGREDLLRAFQLVSELEFGLKASSQPRFLFEAALIRLADLGAVRPIEEILASFDPDRAATATRSPRTSPVGGPTRPPDKKKLAEPSPATPTPGIEAAGAEDSGFVSSFVAAVHDAKPMLGAMLEEAASIRVEGDAVLLVVRDDAETFRRRLKDRDYQEVLAGCARQVSGRAMQVRVATVQTPASPEPDAAEEPSPGEAAGEGRRRLDRHGRPGRQRLLEQARKQPGVRKLMEEFGAQVVDIRPLTTRRPGTGEATDAGPSEEGS